MLLISYHLGLHISRFAALIKHQALRNTLTVIACLTAIYGCYAFAERDFLSSLLPTSSFMFFDADQSIVRLLADFGAIMVLFALPGHITAGLTQHKMKKEK